MPSQNEVTDESDNRKSVSYGASVKRNASSISVNRHVSASGSVRRNASSTSVNRRVSKVLIVGSQIPNEETESVRFDDVSHLIICDSDPDCVGNENSRNVGTTLRWCKMKILKPFRLWLVFIGWRKFGQDTYLTGKWKLRLYSLLNVTYPLFVVFLLLFSYIFDLFACAGNYDVLAVEPNGTETPSKDADLDNDHHIRQKCYHWFSTYILPSLLHFLAYGLGFYAERIREHEQLYGVMEKMSLAVPSGGVGGGSGGGIVRLQRRITKKLRIYLVGGLAWLLLGMFLRFLYSASSGGIGNILFYAQFLHWSGHVPADLGPVFTGVMISLEYLGIIYFQAVNVAVVINYVTECELLCFLITNLTYKLDDRVTSLKQAMKDIHDVRISLRQLNGILSAMTSLVSLGFLNTAVLNGAVIFYLHCHHPTVWIYRSFSLLASSAIFLLPFYQAAKLNRQQEKLVHSALEVRVRGYQSSSIIEQDSFLLYARSAVIKAKLMTVPVDPSATAGYIISLLLLLLLCVQTGVLKPGSFVI